jgi:hypothetical protein
VQLYRPWRIAYFVITVLAAAATVGAACLLVISLR